MFTSDSQILKLPRILKDFGIINSIQQFYDETEIDIRVFSLVKNQDKYGRGYHFTPQQIERICLLYGINFNWVFATSEELFNNPKAQKKHKIT